MANLREPAAKKKKNKVAVFRLIEGHGKKKIESARLNGRKPPRGIPLGRVLSSGGSRKQEAVEKHPGHTGKRT